MNRLNLLIIPFVLSAWLILATSCDPAKILVIQAASEANVSVTVYARNGFLPQYESSSDNHVQIRIPDPYRSSLRDTTFYYGIGGWSQEHDLMEIANKVDSIIIINRDSEVRLINYDDVFKYLLDNRSGFAKRKITIQAN